MKPEDRRRLKQHIEMIVEHKEPGVIVQENFKKLQDEVADLREENIKLRLELHTLRFKEAQVEHLQIRLSEWRGVAMLLVDELNEAKSKQLPTSWEDASVASPAYIAYRNLVDVEDDWAGNRPCRRSGDTLLEVRKEDE